MLVPIQAYLTRGVGVHREELVAFEIALRDAGIAAQNLVTVSSILPPGCELIEREAGERSLRPGQILHVVMSREQTTEAGRMLGASIGIARPVSGEIHGFVAEHGAFDQTEAEIAAHVEDLATTMLATTLGIEVDDGQPRRERARILEESGQIRHRGSITAATEAAPGGVWTCAVAVCVFIMDWMLPSR